MPYRMFKILVLAAAMVLLAQPALSQAENWPGFRGPTGFGYSNEKDLPLTWNAKTGEGVLWKAELHGGRKNNPEFSSPGWSSPIGWGDRVFLTTTTWPAGLSEKERRSSIGQQHVLCYQTCDGKLLWETPIPAGKIVVNNFYHGYTVPTPVTDGKLVFALFGSGVLAALDFDGKIVWREELPHLRDVDGGVCSSPVLHEDTVIVPGLQDMGLRALKKTTGKVKWEQKTKTRNTSSTPVLVHIQGKLQLIHYAGGIQGIDPATGEVLWSCRVQVGNSSPAFASGLLFADVGRGTGNGTAVDATGKGDVTKTHVKWQAKIACAAGSSPIIVGDYLYRISNPDLVRCWKAASGELVYEERAPKITPSSSPIVTPDGRIYFASSGMSYVIKAGPKYEVLATNDLNDRPDYTTPAVSNGRIIIKGKSYLWCIGKK